MSVGINVEQSINDIEEADNVVIFLCPTKFRSKLDTCRDLRNSINVNKRPYTASL